MESKRISWPGWETVRLIGRGSFGAVYEIQRDIFGDIEKAALKVISIPQNAGDIDEMYSDGYDEESITSTFKSHLKSIVAEYSLMRKMNGCANIVNCDDVRYIQHDDGIGWDIFIKMELLTSLTKALPAQASEETVINIAKDICKALELCKKHEIVHRDIKPQNIFVSPNGDYKLGDFGIAKTVEKTMGGTKIGTYKYMAPEVYNNKPYGSAADIYSLGLVLYWLLNERRMPFLPLPPAKLSAGMDEQARNRRLSGEQFGDPKNGSTELKAIVMKACAYNVEERYASASEMLADLNRIGQELQLQSNTKSTVSSSNTVSVDQPRSEDEDKTVGVFRKAESNNVVIPNAQLEEGTFGLFFKPAIEPASTNLAADVDSFAEKEDTTNVQLETESGDVLAIDEEFERKENTARAAKSEKYSTMIPDEKDSYAYQSTNLKNRKSPIPCITLCVGMIAVFLAVFYFFIHFWTPATCTEPSNCKICGKIGEAATGHTWQDATCTQSEYCSKCDETRGAATGHTWQDATCTQSKHCFECGETRGIALGHDWALSADCSGMECNRCDATSAIESLRINKTYCLNDPLDAEHLGLVAIHEGKEFPIESGFSCSPTSLNQIGTQQVTVTYGNLSEKYNVEVLNFHELEIRVANYYGTGYNENRRVYWVLRISARYHGNLVTMGYKNNMPVKHSWSGNFETSWMEAKNGTASSWGYSGWTEMMSINNYIGGACILPDDPSFAGDYTATMKFGDVTKTVTFTLVYEGDYETGTGWSVTNIKWS